ncbi:MAG: hypothetical protein WB563_03775, partial [Pseudolabrys sp.]
ELAFGLGARFEDPDKYADLESSMHSAALATDRYRSPVCFFHNPPPSQITSSPWPIVTTFCHAP